MRTLGDTATVLLAYLLLAGLANTALAAKDPCGDEYMAGYELLQHGDPAAARARFENALEAADKNWKKGACHYRVAECFEKEGDLLKAVEHYARSARAKRTDRHADELGRQRYVQDAIEKLSAIAPKVGKGDVARDAIDHLLGSFSKLSPRDRTQAYERAAESLAVEGKTGEAVSYLEAKIREDKYVTPQSAAQLRLTAGKLLARGGQYEDAVAILAKSIATPGLGKRVRLEAALLRGETLVTRLGRIDEGHAQFEQVIDDADARRRSDIRMAIADSYEKGKQFDQARAAYESLMRDDKCQLGKRREAADRLAKLLHRQGGYAEAKAFLLQAVEEVFARAHEKQRLLQTLYDLARRGDPDTAMDACDRIIALEHEDQHTAANWRRDGLRRKAEIRWGQRKRAEAIALLEQALKVEPGNHNQRLDLRLRLGQWQSECGEHEAAHRQFEHVLQNAGRDQWKAFLTRTRMSEAFRRERRYAEGRAAIEEALKTPNLRDDNRADLHNRMGELFRDEKRYDEAVAAYDEIEALPKASADWKCRGVERATDMLRHQKKYDEAVKRLEAAQAEKIYQPKHQSALFYMLARVCLEAGRKGKATTACQKVIALNVNKHHVRDAKVYLSRLAGE